MAVVLPFVLDANAKPHQLPSGYGLSLQAATSSVPSLVIPSSSGTQPGSPVSGWMYWDGTGLYFYTGSQWINLLGGAAMNLSRTDTKTTATAGTTISVGSLSIAKFGLQVTSAGGTATWNVVLEGCLDNTTFTTILTHSNTGEYAAANGATVWATSITSPVLYFRSRVVALGAASTLTILIIGA